MGSIDVVIIFVITGAVLWSLKRVLRSQGGCNCNCSDCKVKCSEKR